MEFLNEILEYFPQERCMNFFFIVCYLLIQNSVTSYHLGLRQWNCKDKTWFALIMVYLVLKKKNT